MIVPERVALLISGTGSTAEAVIRATQNDPDMHVKPVVVIASRPDSLGLQKAQELGIPTEVVDRSKHDTLSFGNALLETLDRYKPTLVAQLGWLPTTAENVVNAFEGKMINQHPGRLPDFGGKGMYGSRVTCATIATFWMTGEEDPWTASTVHLVSLRVDEGSLLQVARMNLPYPPRTVSSWMLLQHPGELVAATLETQRRLLGIEHENVISVLKRFVVGEIRPTQQPEPLYVNGDKGVLFEAKQIAAELFPKG